MICLFTQKVQKVTQTLLGLKGEFSKVSGYEVNIQKSIVFVYSSNEQLELE